MGTKLPLDVRPELGPGSPLAFVPGPRFLVDPYPGSGAGGLPSCNVECRSLICILNLPGATEPGSHGAQPPAEPGGSTGAERVSSSALQALGSG